MKICPDDKILNPKTNRCVSRTGKIGKSLIELQKPADLNYDVLNIIAKKANSATKKTLKEVNKHFRTTIITKKSYGRKNAEYLIEYLKKNLKYNTNLYITKYEYVNIKYKLLSNDMHSLRLTKYNYNIDNTPERIGYIKYKSNLDNVIIRDFVNNNYLEYFSNLLNNLIFIEDNEINVKTKIFKKWSKFINKNRDKLN